MGQIRRDATAALGTDRSGASAAGPCQSGTSQRYGVDFLPLPAHVGAKIGSGRPAPLRYAAGQHGSKARTSTIRLMMYCLAWPSRPSRVVFIINLDERKVGGAEILPRNMLPLLSCLSPAADGRPLFFRSYGSADELPASF